MGYRTEGGSGNGWASATVPRETSQYPEEEAECVQKGPELAIETRTSPRPSGCKINSESPQLDLLSVRENSLSFIILI